MLTEKEKQLVEMTVSGKSAVMIAGCINVSTRTVEDRYRRIYRKLGVTNKVQMIHAAHIGGIIDYNEVASGGKVETE